jgi:cell shape-determining protein MreD
VTIADGLKAAVMLFVAAIAQVSIFSQVRVFGGEPQLVLVTLVSVALLRGAVVGAIAGFFAGLVIDTAMLGQLGLTSLVLTVSGYWIGRYGETTGRAAGRLREQGSHSLSAAPTSGRLRGHAPFLSVAVVTCLYAFGILLVTFMLGERAPAGPEMRSLLPTIVMNLILTGPTYWVVRHLLRPRERGDYATEVQLLG